MHWGRFGAVCGNSSYDFSFSSGSFLIKIKFYIYSLNWTFCLQNASSILLVYISIIYRRFSGIHPYRYIYRRIQIQGLNGWTDWGADFFGEWPRLFIGGKIAKSPLRVMGSILGGPKVAYFSIRMHCVNFRTVLKNTFRGDRDLKLTNSRELMRILR